MNVFDKIKGGLIVSCQALETEPLYSSKIMARMAFAAKEGGAVGIRANTPEDIIAIKKEVDLPVIGLYKVDYDNSEIYITPTMKEIDAIMTAAPDSDTPGTSVCQSLWNAAYASRPLRHQNPCGKRQGFLFCQRR